jgi:CRP-like cAMP-binding protein
MNSEAIEHLLSNWEYFRGLSGEPLKALAQIARHHTSKNSEALVVSEGQENLALYVLIEGTLRIEIEGNVINLIDRPGDTAGEMSWVTGIKASASVVAERFTSYLSFSFEELKELDQKFNNQIKEHFIRVFPLIVSKRLIATNAKAKAVAELIEKLRTTEDSLRLMNETLEYQIARRERETFEQIHNIAEKILPQLLNYVTQSKKNSPSDSKAQKLLEEFETQLSQMKSLLNGLMLNKEQEEIIASVVGHKLDPREASALKTVLNSFGLIEEVETSQQALPSNQKRILITGSLNTSDLAQNNFDHRIALLKNLNLADLSGIAQFDTLIHCRSESRSAIIRTLTTGLNKVVFGNIWGLHKYLSWGTKIYQHKITNSSKRLDTINAVLGRLKEAGIRNTILSQIHLVIEELLMNAIYDAPTDDDGNSIYNHVNRKQQVTLPDSKEVTVSFGTDGITAGIAVADPFGSLAKDIILSYLEFGAKGVDASSPKKGGAGKGLYLIVTNSSQTIFNIERGRKTEVICLFDLERKNADQQNDTPSFHFYFC